MELLDCRAHQCPHPVVETRKAMLAEPESLLTVLVGDEAALVNVTRLAESQGYRVDREPVEGGFSLRLTPGGKTTAGPDATPATGKTVIFVASDRMGAGDDELGTILLKNFLITLAELNDPPDTLLFVNAGVKLTVRGSEGVQPLEHLAGSGTDIASCGLCLDFYGLKDQVAVGRITNMLEIVESLRSAGRVIRP